MLERVLFAGGGTGGHIFMAVALAEELKRRDSQLEVLFVGARKGLERKLLPALGFPLKTIKIGGLKGVGLMQIIRTLVQFPASLGAARTIVRNFLPSIIVGLGGYSSGPVMMAGRSLGCPLVLIEPNVYPGFTNRALRRWVDGVAVAFEETSEWFAEKARLTGIPVRREFFEVSQDILVSERLRLLVFGGSQGSRPINQMVCDALPFLPSDRITLVHQTGRDDYMSVQEKYQAAGVEAEVLDFIQDMPSYMARSDLILSRAGASTVAEIAAAGRPAILVPLPQATDDHQRKNAAVFVKRQAAVVMEQEETTGRELARVLVELAGQHDHLRQMAKASRGLAQPGSREKIVDFME
ncbi:MAG: undecaprenyldiphospho-muramoylpentapeptide beta-N-acetylglucosaminyltransferase, partial [Acidobacteria bacterium]|nr:undecaprenyldiphospho-muramoylpentapeptide beta-N-acetylglucosaminyltransferase [Acidobacteriota bacterium]